jgi:hypothetical protein
MANEREDLAAWIACPDAEETLERHGSAELVRRRGVPIRARGCRLPDGTTVHAECLTSRADLQDAEQVWSRPVGPPRSRLRRRGRLEVVPGANIRFHDEPTADLTGDAAGALLVDPNAEPSLEEDLARSTRLLNLVRGSQLFAQLLYHALDGTEWRHETSGARWGVGPRQADEIVADLRGRGDSLFDWFGTRGSGVDEVVAAEIAALGWRLIEPGEGDTTGADRSEPPELVLFEQVTPPRKPEMTLDEWDDVLIARGGGAWHLTEAVERLGTTREALHRQILDDEVLGMVRGPLLLVPRCQFEEADGKLVPLPGLREVLTVFRGAEPLGWPALQYFVTPSPNLRGRRPLDVLAEGRVADVVHAARAHLGLTRG